jgi:hypothetical protein
MSSPNTYYNIITDEEAFVMVKALGEESIDEEGNTVPALDEIETIDMMEMIDNHLILMRSKTLMLKKQGIKNQLIKTIDLYLNNK